MGDPAFPALHIRPARGWLNDPNGLCRIDGTYHVFFQYNPHAPVHGNVHWGHVRSTDLLQWTEQPVALAPRPGGMDAAGCWSGCIVDDDGVPTAVYTANPDHAWNATVGIARSDRTLESWVQADEPVVPAPAGPAVEEVRDPFLFEFQGRRYAVQGAGRRGGPPALLLWSCDDIEHWVPLGPLLTADDAVAAEVAPADIWECPNVAYVDGRWVVLLSVWRWVDGSHQLDGVRYLLGDLDSAGDGPRFRPTAGGQLDDGPAFYAPQLLPDRGRTLLWGWSWELGRDFGQVAQAGWAGSLTFPRELVVRGERLGNRPAAELVGLRRERLDLTDGGELTVSSFEVVARGPVTLELVDDSSAEPVVAMPGSADEPARIQVDGSMVEAFTADRSTTARAYPTESSRWRVTADAPVEIWRLGLR
ncbi:MAG TPA: glycoside hydrolase family 32 protein [Propionibacteriaceae bacterium]|nr:glycoside hydrolase family 32 protein [Propionibacteriaceae bacterium]